MKLQIDNLGKVAITVDKNYWDIDKDYDKLTIVPVKDKFATYISRKPVPAGTVLTDTTYWIPFSSLKEEIILDYNNWVSQNNENVKQYVEDVIRHNKQIISILEDITGINIHLEDVILRVRTLETNVNTINEELNNIQDTLNTKGKPGGFAELNESGQIPSEVLPSFVDDVVEYETISDFPHPGEQGKIYIETSTNFSYRWSGSEYIQMPKNYTLPAATDTVLGGIKLGPHMRLNDDNKLLIDMASTFNDGLMRQSDKQFVEKQKLEIITYNGEEINPKKDFAVIMNDGSLYIERNIDWSTKVVDFLGKKAIDLHNDRNLFSSEYAPKFSKILSLGDLSPADGIRLYALWHIKLPYCYPWGRPKVLGLIKSDIPEGSNLSEDYLEYQLKTKIPPKYDFTYKGPAEAFEFIDCDFTECEYAADTLDYEYGDICSVHLDTPVGDIKFYGSKFNTLPAIKCKQINTLTNQMLMFSGCQFNSLPVLNYPEGEAGNHIMDPENPTATHINTDLYNNWKFSALTNMNSMFQGAAYTGPDSDKYIIDFSVFDFKNVTNAWHAFYYLQNMPHIQLYLPKLSISNYEFESTSRIKTIIITDVGPNSTLIFRDFPKGIEHIEMNLTNANSFGIIKEKAYTANIVLLYHLKCNCNISNFPLIGDDSVERTLTYLQTVTNNTFTLNTNVYNRIIKQDKFKELIAAAEAKGWRITHATTEAADKVYNAKYDNITSRLSNVEEDVSNLTTQVDSIEPYTLPVATQTILGGVKSSIDNNLNENTHSFKNCIAVKDDGTIVIKGAKKGNLSFTTVGNTIPIEMNIGSDNNGLSITNQLRIYDGTRELNSDNRNIVVEQGLAKVVKDIAIYPFDGFTDSFDNETRRPNGTILWHSNSFYIKINGEWTSNQSDLPNYIKPGLGGGNVRNDRLFRYNNLLYRFDELGDIGNTLVPIVPLATDETYGIIKVNRITDNINKSICTNSDGEIGISVGNSNVKGTIMAAAEELGYGNISFDIDSTSLTPNVNLYIYDGTRNLVSTSNSLIAEKGLVKVLEPYVKTNENYKISANVVPFLSTWGSTSYSNASSTSLYPIRAKIENVDGKLEVKILFSSYERNREPSSNNINVVLESGLAYALKSYPKLENNLIPAQYLPSYVDDVLEFESLSAFPTTGETGKIYVDTTENRTYRWSGTQYTEIGKSLALGETSSTAYAGDKGAANAIAISNIQSTLNSLDDDYAKLTDGKVDFNVLPVATTSKIVNTVRTPVIDNIGTAYLYKKSDGSLDINITLNTYTGQEENRELGDNNANLVEEKALYKELQKYAKLNASGKISANTLPIDTNFYSTALPDVSGYNSPIYTELSITGGKLKVTTDVSVFDGSRALSATSTNVVMEKGLYSVINPINSSISTLQSNLNNLTDAVNGITPYTLPMADYNTLGGVKITSTTPNLDVVGIVECTTLNDNNRLCIIVRNDHTVNTNTAASIEVPLTISRDGTGGSLKFKADLNVFDGTRDANEDSSNLVTEKGLMSVMNILAALVYSYPKDIIEDAEYMTTLINGLKTNTAFKAAIKEIVQEVLNENSSTN